MDDLIVSIRENGLIQPILVRPHPDGDGYELTAGERRFRACGDAGLTTIPVLLRDMTTEEMTAAAVTENSAREDISAAEEARVTQRAVSACNGSRSEACRLLGWSAQKLASRLALVNANESVLSALEQRRIPLGIAELMASVLPESQDATLETIINEGRTVEEFRQQLGSFTRELVSARLDTSDCTGCQFNSATQRGLIDTALELCRLNASLQALGHAGLSVCLYDGDVVSESNVGRQRFSMMEVGTNKAVALINHISLFYGVRREGVPRHFDTFGDRSCPLTITATYGASFRHDFASAQMSQVSSLWLDFGNGSRRGQAVLGHRKPRSEFRYYNHSPRDTVRLPNVIDLFPDMADDPNDGPS